MRSKLPEPSGGFITRWARIDNGVYFVDTVDGPSIAVHYEIADEELSGTARTAGIPREDYLYFIGIKQAIPLYELSRRNNAVSGFANQENVMKTLRDYFPDYFNSLNPTEEPATGENDWEPKQ